MIQRLSQDLLFLKLREIIEGNRDLRTNPVTVTDELRLKYHFVLFCFDSCSGKQLFSHFETEPPILGYYQYFWGVNVSCLRKQHTDPAEDRTRVSRSRVRRVEISCHLKSINNNKKFRSFKSKENIHKKEVGPYRSFGYLSLISDPINLAKGAGE